MKFVSSEPPIRSRSGNWQSQDTGTPVPATKGAPLSAKRRQFEADLQQLRREENERIKELSRYLPGREPLF